jgi:hypothetical protein
VSSLDLVTTTGFTNLAWRKQLLIVLLVTEPHAWLNIRRASKTLIVKSVLLSTALIFFLNDKFAIIAFLDVIFRYIFLHFLFFWISKHPKFVQVSSDFLKILYYLFINVTHLIGQCCLKIYTKFKFEWWFTLNKGSEFFYLFILSYGHLDLLITSMYRINFILNFSLFKTHWKKPE